ncbi:hypothetical protein OIU76_009820 [Salix suchowensis]|nr:hypothetical protein OIU76_009820 [Salix suchowensis]
MLDASEPPLLKSFLFKDKTHARRYIAMMEMSRVAGERDQLITLLLPLAEHVLDIILVHFREGSMSSDNSGATKAVTFGTHTDPRQDLSLMCGMLVPTLERLELLSEVFEKGNDAGQTWISVL